MNVLIRDCRIGDSIDIQVLNQNELGYEYPLEAVEGKLENLLRERTHKIVVAVVDGKVIGYVHACAYDLLYAPPLKNIMGIAVSSDFKKRGIGKKLLNYVEQWARDTGADGVRLVSGATRTGAHAFYTACGYSCNKEQKYFIKYFKEKESKS